MKLTFINHIVLCLIFLLLSCENTYNNNEIIRIENLAYLKKDTSLVTGKVRVYNDDRLVSEITFINGKEQAASIRHIQDSVSIDETIILNHSRVNSKADLDTFEDIHNIISVEITQSKKFTIDNYTIKIIWDKQLSYSENIGYYGGIKSMTIAKDGIEFNVIHEIEDKIGLGEIVLSFFDYNLDGHLDFTVPISCGKICWNKYYLFNPLSNKYEHRKDWDYLRIAHIDKKKKQILSLPNGNAIEDNSKLYQIDGLKLIEIFNE